MAQLALGVLGAVAGSAFGPLGASIGWSIGAAIGGALFPQKVEGPRLTDLRLQQSVYGGMIPILYGTMRVAGNVIWQTDLQEHEQHSGGKGGPDVTNYTYSASFAIRFCEGPVLGVLRVWADGRLVYDVSQGSTTDNSNFPFTFYRGTEDQLPDPTMEAALGVGNVPGYRGLALMVFDALMLTDYGNRIPNINAELYTKAGAIPVRVSTFATAHISGTSITAASWDSETSTIIVGVYTIGGGGGQPAFSYAETVYDLDGTVVSSTDFAATGAESGANIAIISNANIACFEVDSVAQWFVRGVQVTFAGIQTSWPSGTGIVQGDFLYVAHGPLPHGLSRFPMTDGIPSATADINFTFGTSASNLIFGSSDDGNVYVFDQGAAELYKFDRDLVLQHTWTESDLPDGFSFTQVQGHNFFRYHDFFCFSYAGLGFQVLNLIAIDGTTLSLYPQTRTTGDLPVYDYQTGPIIPLVGGYVLGMDGVTLLDPPIGPAILGEIVADLSERVDLTSSDYDVSDLPDIVPGYLITSQSPCRTALEQLQNGFFFDGAEIDDKAVFRHRGHASIATIPDGELAAHEKDSELPAPLGRVRGQETELPARINVDYIDIDADYQNGTQAAERQVTSSTEKKTISLAIGMDRIKAKAVANATIFEAWFERDKGRIQLPRKWEKLTPMDVITVKGKTWRVRNVTATPKGVLTLDIVPSIPSIYVQPGASVKALGITGGGAVVPTKSLTDMTLLDIPLLDDGDSGFGFKAALSPTDGAWSGSSLQKSSDGGTSYAEAASTTIAAVKGTASNALGNYYGGNTVDEINMAEVVVNGALSGTTYAGLLNGEREILLGDEVIWYRDAELVDTDTYQLSGLLRGRYGTEWAMSLHQIGDRFAVLPALEVPAPSGDLTRERLYKAVTFGKTLASVTAVAFANSGVRLKPLSPVQLGGGSDDIGNVTMNWNRRTRIGGTWADFVDAALGESSEKYEVQIWDASYTQCARIIEVTSTTASYSAADQVTDFGVEQQTIYFSVGQVGTIGLGRQAQGSVPGIGAGDNAPLVPVTPYNNPIIPSGGSGSCAPVGSVVNGTVSWTTPARIFSGAFDENDVWVVQFTTGANVSGGGLIQFGYMTGFEGIAVDAYIATSPCGTAILTETAVLTPAFFFQTPTPLVGQMALTPNTTYFVMIVPSTAHSMYCEIIPSR